MLVVAMDDTKYGRRGHFAGFADPTLSHWYLTPLAGGERERFESDELEVPSATAEACMGSSKTRGECVPLCV